MLNNTRRKTHHSNHSPDSRSSPPLESRKKRTFTLGSKELSFKVNRLRKNPKHQLYEYKRLTMESLAQQYPVCQLKPYSSFYSIEKVQKNLKQNEKTKIFIRTKQKNNFLNNTNENVKQYKTNIFGLNSNNKQSKTFYQKSNKKKRSKFYTQTYFNYKPIQDDEQIMVKEYLKDNSELNKLKKKLIERVNEKIKMQHGTFFEPDQRHQESKCRSSSCNQAFFKRKKLSVERKYTLDQPHSINIKYKKSKKAYPLDQNLQFFIYSRARNRVIPLKTVA